MQTYQIAKGIDLDFGATASGTAIDMSAVSVPLPFQAGGSAIAVLALNNWAEAEAGAHLYLQGSDNAFSGWENLADVGGGVTGVPFVMTQIEIPAWLRWHQAGNTAGDGRGSIYLLQN